MIPVLTRVLLQLVADRKGGGMLIVLGLQLSDETGSAADQNDLAKVLQSIPPQARSGSTAMW